MPEARWRASCGLLAGARPAQSQLGSGRRLALHNKAGCATRLRCLAGWQAPSPVRALCALTIGGAGHRQAQERVKAAADWLFKVIGAANEVLSDAAKRRKLDTDLQLEAVLASAARPPASWDHRRCECI